MDAVLELRDAVSSGFARVEGEIRALDGRLEDLRNDIARHFSIVDSRFDRMDEWFDRFEARP